MKVFGVKPNQIPLCPPQVNPACTDLGSDMGLYGEWPVGNRLSDGKGG